jgi:hypothetical protein
MALSLLMLRAVSAGEMAQIIFVFVLTVLVT